MSLFVRNDPKVIQDSMELTVEEFVLKYRPVTNEEVLSKAYLEIRKKELLKNPPPVPVEKAIGKSVVFKVIPKKKDQPAPKPVMAIVPDEEEEDILPVELSHEEEVENGLDVAKGVADKRNVEKSVQGEKKERKTRNSEKGAKRDARVLELLVAGKKPVEIIEIMEKEGFKVHAPQISNVRVKWQSEENLD